MWTRSNCIKNNNNKLNRVSRYKTAFSSWWLKQVNCEKAENKINQLAWGKKWSTGAFFCLSIQNIDEPWTFGFCCSRQRRREKVLKINSDADTAHLELAVRIFPRFSALIAMTIPSHRHWKMPFNQNDQWVPQANLYIFFVVTLCGSVEQQCANLPPVFVRQTSQNQSQPICSDSVRSLLQLFVLVSSLESLPRTNPTK